MDRAVEALPGIQQKHLISGTVRRQDGVQLRVVSETAPSAEAEALEPSLEDVYLHLVSSNGGRP